MCMVLPRDFPRPGLKTEVNVPSAGSLLEFRVVSFSTAFFSRLHRIVKYRAIRNKPLLMCRSYDFGGLSSL